MKYVLSDIHGNLDAFNKMLEKIDFCDDDILYVLGDAIDRNPYGIEILQRIMSSQNIRMILGNHEFMMLNALNSEKYSGGYNQEYKTGLWYQNGGDITHRRLKQLTKKKREEIISFLESLPLNICENINGNKYLLVHGTVANEECNDYETVQDVVWHRIKESDEMPPDMTVIFGHTPTVNYTNCLPMKIWHGENRMGIDCGCAYTGCGRLACIRLDYLKEFYV